MRAQSFLYFIALFGLLTAGLAAPVSAQSVVTLPPSYETNIIASESDVYGDWQRSLEKVTFFLDHDTSVVPSPGPAGGDIYLPNDDDASKGYFHYEPPVDSIPVEATSGEDLFYEPFHKNDKRVSLTRTQVDTATLGEADADVTALFRIPTQYDTLPMDLNPTRPYRIYGAEATLYVGCVSADLEGGANQIATEQVGAGVGVNLRFQAVNPDGTLGGYRDFGSGADTDHFLTDTGTFSSGYVTGASERLPPQFLGTTAIGAVEQIFRVTVLFNPLGNFITENGHRNFVVDPSKYIPVFDVGLANEIPAGNCQLHFGSKEFPSNFRLITDTASMNTWIDDKDDRFTTGLPSAKETSQEQRRMKTVIAHGSAWPSFNGFKYREADETNYQDLPWGAKIYTSGSIGISSSTLIDGSYNKDVHSAEDGFQLRWRSEVTNDIYYDTRTGDDDIKNRIIKPIDGTRVVEALPDGLNLIKEDFLYGADLPDGSIHFEIYSARFQLARSTTATVGLKGFSFELFESPGETDLIHEIERKEPTVYRLLLRNLGAQEDTVTLRATGVGSGWTASLSATRMFLPAAGPSLSEFGQEVLLTVTPGANLQIGAETAITVTATSKYTQEVQPQTLVLTTKIVAEEQPAVDLFGDTSLVQVNPGDKLILQDLFVHNLGTSADTYIVEAKLPGGIGLGWTTRALPPGKLVEADSIEDFAIEINVAADAKPGQRITLPVTARLAGNQGAPVVDTLEIPIEVILEHGLSFSVVEKTHALRVPKEACGLPGRDPFLGYDYGGDCAKDDSDASLASLYRLRFTNNGPVDETYSLRGDWEKGTLNGITVTWPSSGACDTGANPEFWRVDYAKTGDAKLNGVATGAGEDEHQKAGAQLETFVVPAGQTVERWVELGYEYQDNVPDWIFCSNSAISPAALFRLVATPLSEPTAKSQIMLGGFLMGDFGQDTIDQANRIHGLSLEPALNLKTNVVTPASKESELKNQAFQEVRYQVVARNEGNEKDTLSFSTVASNGGAADYSLEYRADLSTKSTYSGCQNTQAAAQSRTWTCRDMDSYAEVVFDLVVKPSATASVGSSLTHGVTVVSKDDGLKTESLSFTTKLVGERLFGSAPTVGARSAEPGQEVNLPFYIDNKGTRDDTYSVVLTSGNRDYKPRFSIDDQVFVPATNRLDAFLRVQVPTDVVVGTSEVFTALVTSSDPSLGPVTLTFRVNVIEDTGVIVRAAGGSSSVLIRDRGTPQNVDVEAIVATASQGDPITFRVDRAKLPSGWTVGSPVATGSLGPHQSGFISQAAFAITAPVGAIGTSSVPLIVDVCLNTQDNCVTNADFIASGDIIMNLQDDVGVALVLENPDVARATLPGGDVVYPIRVENRGLSSDLVELSNTEPGKAGWSIDYDPPILSLAPLESRVVDVIVSSPATAAPGERIDFLLFATSTVDPSEFDQMALSAEIGVFKLEVRNGTPTASLAPGETRTFTTTVYNNGTLPEAVFASSGLVGAAAQAAYGSIVDIAVMPSSFELQPGKNKDITVTVKVGPSIAPKVTVPVKVDFTSVPNAPTKATSTFDVKILDYRARDVDGDGIVEYAIDRDGKSSNGFEEFRDAVTNAGTQTKPANLVRFLNAEGLARHSTKTTVNGTVVTVTNLFIDGDVSPRGDFGDGRADLFLDDTGDGLPDLYWDPDDRHSHRILIFKDIDADGVPDYFVDTSGNGNLDAVYNLAQGTFTGLLARDVDNDGTLDFVVDKNGNGLVDADETILFTKNGKLVQVTKVDVDGDGKLDDVFDTDGDGVPDYFIPAGKTKGVPIKVERDVNGDGFLDWTYDANRDGKDDHFYDPAAQTGGNQIDTVSEFVRSIQQYWYIGGLFILVAGLFVVLIAVTRR